MSQKDDGGPAFPVAWPLPNAPEPGMSLRDYLAAKADIGDVDELTLDAGVRLIGRECPNFKDDQIGCFRWWADYRSMLRYIEADAMLKAREL